MMDMVEEGHQVLVDSLTKETVPSSFTSVTPENSIVSSTSSTIPWLLPCPPTADPKISDGRIYKCDQCARQFRQKTTLQQHERTHSDSRPYGCPECGKSFRQQSHLKQHLRIHSKEKPYPCEFCKKTFRQLAILNQHLRIHSGEKPYECPECKKSFRQKAILDQHVRTHLGEKSKKKSETTVELSPSSSGPEPAVDTVDLTLD
jgi:uncharacterized Zn-finger protein